MKVDDRYKVLLILYSATLSNKLLLDMGKKREYIFIQTLMNESGELNIKILDNIDEIER